MADDYVDKSIGEIADSALGDLTRVEEELDIVEPRNDHHAQDIDAVKMQLSRAQRKLAEIRRRHEETVGPIGSTE
jgi:hypothetical protein